MTNTIINTSRCYTTSPPLIVATTTLLAPSAASRDKMMAAELDHLVQQAKGKVVPHSKAKRQLGL